MISHDLTPQMVDRIRSDNDLTKYWKMSYEDALYRAELVSYAFGFHFCRERVLRENKGLLGGLHRDYKVVDRYYSDDPVNAVAWQTKYDYRVHPTAVEEHLAPKVKRVFWAVEKRVYDEDFFFEVLRAETIDEVRRSVEQDYPQIIPAWDENGVWTFEVQTVRRRTLQKFTRRLNEKNDLEERLFRLVKKEG